MERKWIAAVVIVFLISSIALAYERHSGKMENPSTFALALQPLPNGKLTVLEKGSLGKVLEATVRNGEWVTYLKEDSHVLKSVPAPIVLYFTSDNRIVVGTLKDGKLGQTVELNLTKLLERAGSGNTGKGVSECPKGYVQVSDRYCIDENEPVVKGRVKLVQEWVPFMGMKIDTVREPINVVSLSWGIILDSTAVAGYTLNVAGTPAAVPGNEYDGEKLRIAYSPEGIGLRTSNGSIERYVNLPLRYLTFRMEIACYDRYTGEYTHIPISGTYPVEIQLTGEYNLTEGQLNKKITSSTGMEGSILTDHPIKKGLFPTINSTRQIRVGQNGYYTNIVFDFQGGRGYFYTFPVGGSDDNPSGEASAQRFLTISYSPHAKSFLTYSITIIRATPNATYIVATPEIPIKLPGGEDGEEVATYFTVITTMRT